MKTQEEVVRQHSNGPISIYKIYQEGYQDRELDDWSSFPELAESEDERIRKRLYNYISYCPNENFEFYGGVGKGAVLAYLEKQKEQTSDIILKAFENSKRDYSLEERKEASDYSEKVLPTSIAYGESEEEYLLHKVIEAAYIAEQKEQIPYIDFVIKPHKGDNTNPYDMSVSEAQEYAINRGFGIPFNDGEVYVDERHITQTIGNILRWADEHPKEQKSYLTVKGDGVYKGTMEFDTVMYDNSEMEEQKSMDYTEELEKCRKNPLYFFDKYVKIKMMPVEWDEYTKTNLDRALQIIKKAKGNLQGYQSDDGIYECNKAIECLEHFLYRGLEIEKQAE